MAYSTIIVKMLLSAFLGAVIGIEREINGCGAGLRTHILVCIGSTLIMITSIMVGLSYGNVDPSRIAAGVVTGIGFLGAGAIMRYGSSVRGLTTAASIWAVSAIGLATGAGLYAPAVLTAVITVTILILSHIERILDLKKGRKELIVKVDTSSGMDVGEINRMIESHGGRIFRVFSDNNEVSKKVRLAIRMELEEVFHKELAERIDGLNGVEEVYWK